MVSVLFFVSGTQNRETKGMSMEKIEFQVEAIQGEERIDRYLAEHIKTFSRTYLQKLIQQEYVLVNGRIVKRSYMVEPGDQIILFIPKQEELIFEPEKIPLDILYEDEDVLVVNKPKGMVVHPGAGHQSGTLVNALLYHCKGQLSGINGVLRPGIVHRIDRDTTGVLVVCKNDVAHHCLAEQLKEHSITRRYEAIALGPFSEQQGRIETLIGRHPIERKKMAVVKQNGKQAITTYQVLQNFKMGAYISCVLETGRTHQIRVHLAHIGHPLLGDSVYGDKKNKYHLQGQTLHAKVLGFIHPTKRVYMEFVAPLPAYFVDLLKKIERTG